MNPFTEARPYKRQLKSVFDEKKNNIYKNKSLSITYDHRFKRTGHPVRSAVLKLEIGGLVVGSVTTSEYPLLYV